MLTYVLALAVALGSLTLYIAAFFFPEVHRKNDLIWSGVGLFYALVLWACAGRITGGVLLGQVASVALLGWFGWQTLALRREQTPIDQRTALPGSADSFGSFVRDKAQQLQAQVKQGDFSQIPQQVKNWTTNRSTRSRTFQGTGSSSPGQSQPPAPTPAPEAKQTDIPSPQAKKSSWQEQGTKAATSLQSNVAKVSQTFGGLLNTTKGRLQTVLGKVNQPKTAGQKSPPKKVSAPNSPDFVEEFEEFEEFEAVEETNLESDVAATLPISPDNASAEVIESEVKALNLEEEDAVDDMTISLDSDLYPAEQNQPAEGKVASTSSLEDSGSAASDTPTPENAESSEEDEVQP